MGQDLIKLSIIVPFSRQTVNLDEIINSLNKVTLAQLELIIVSSTEREDELKEWLPQGLNIKLYHTDEETVYGNNYRNIGVKNASRDWLYFLDDDNIMHPNFNDLLEVLDKDKDVVFFSQIFPNQKLRLMPVTIDVGGVDTAMFMVKKSVMDNHKWEEGAYTADGILAKELSKYNCQYIYTPYCFYNYQQETIFNENIIPSKRILAYMDFGSPTGFATVSHNVLDRLTPWFIENKIKVDVAALNYADRPHARYNQVITIINPMAFADNSEDYYWRDGILKLLSHGDYDLFWAMNDVPVIGPMADFIKQLQTKREFYNKKLFKTILYTPIDSVPFARYFNNLNFFDEIVTYTEYGKRMALDAYYKANKNIMTDVKFDIIAHGTDKKSFKKLDNKLELRKKYDLPTDAFIYGNFNTNSPRKDFGTTLIAFSYLKKQRPDINAVLYLHTEPNDKQGIKMYVACERLDLKPGVDVFFPLQDKYKRKKYSTKEINELYNCLDVFVTTTTAEGWGLTVTEAMACELPIVCGLHTSLNEITDNGELVYAVKNIYEHIQLEDAENIREVLDPKETTERMIEAYEDCKLDIAKTFYSHKMEEYDWDKIAEQWKEKFKNILYLP
jgi:glycosyltransferase involved in cell wall biosynthesis